MNQTARLNKRMWLIKNIDLILKEVEYARTHKDETLNIGAFTFISLSEERGVTDYAFAGR